VVAWAVNSTKRCHRTCKTESPQCGARADLACSTYTPGTTHPDIAFKSANASINEASLGLKVRLFKRLVGTGNVLIKIDDGGFRSRVVPLVELSYSFRPCAGNVNSILG